jgi:hypothetical protein
MIFRKKKIQPMSTAQIEEEHKKADAQVDAAKQELSLAKAMGSDIRRIRSENNFMNDFRAALGGGSN